VQNDPKIFCIGVNEIWKFDIEYNNLYKEKWKKQEGINVYAYNDRAMMERMQGMEGAE
jgi:hypothetical protein